MTTYLPGTEVKIVGNYLSCITDAKIGSVAKMTSGVLRNSGLYEVEYEGNNSKTYVGFIHPKDFKLINTQPTKNQRIGALEKEVAELKKVVEGLKPNPKNTIRIEVDTTKLLDSINKATPKHSSLPQPNNQKRAAIIEKAKRFVEKHTTPNSTTEEWRERGAIIWNGFGTIPYFTSNIEKLTVTLVLKGASSGNIKHRVTVKCHPHDVFNEHIGQAIAIGRALGLDVSEFEQAEQPDEVVVGMEIEYTNEYLNGDKRIVKEINPYNSNRKKY